ncbi:MAG: glycoside-pentoside-hexuronide (GPH):cation symporter [Chloroflexi bacterium]|nr:glycoside-pentoside-hexuronide (GPH):cation symporter [Chloroflexota bacterium]
MNGKLSPRVRWIYGSGDLGFSLTNTILSVYFALFLTDVVGVKPYIAAIAIFVGSTWDYVNDPIVGYISDRTRSRWGRRRPFLLFGALPFAATFVLLWWRPPFESAVALGIYYAVVFALYDTAATFVYMPYFALTPELSGDYDERTGLTSTRMFFSILGSLIAFTLPLWVVDGFHPEHASRVLMMGAIFGLASALPLFLVFLNTRERPEFMNREQTLGVKESIKATWQNRPFVFGLVMFLFNGVTMSIIQVILLYYVKYVVQRESQSDMIMATIFVVAMIALPLWVWISSRLNKRWAYISGISFLAVVLLILSTLTPGTSFVFIMILCVLAGIGVSAMHVMPWAILPDAIEYGEWKTGERQEGMFYSLITLAQKVASSIAVPAALLVLQATGYVPNSTTQPASAIAGIRLVAGLIPAFTISMGILFTLLYPLGREDFKNITRELEARRIVKKADAEALK